MYQNFVKRPSVGTEGAKLWASFDAKQIAVGRELTVDHAVGIAQQAGTKESNARIEFKFWRKFHGVEPAKKIDLENLKNAKSEYEPVLRACLIAGTDSRDLWAKL